ncbi:MAG: DUF7239 family protein [Acidimicrobiales bacterium]
MSERENRLPRWAQIELRSLREQNEALRLRLRDVVPGRSDAFVRDHRHGHLPLGKGVTIRFMLNDDDDPRESRSSIDVGVRDGYLHVMGGERLTIRPEMTNVVRIELRQFQP